MKKNKNKKKNKRTETTQKEKASLDPSLLWTGSSVRYSRLAGHEGLGTAAPLCCSSMKAATGQTTYKLTDGALCQ